MGTESTYLQDACTHPVAEPVFDLSSKNPYYTQQL